MGTEITDEVWETWIENIRSSSLNVRHDMIQVRVVHTLQELFGVINLTSLLRPFLRYSEGYEAQVSLSTLLARKLLLQFWKPEKFPTFDMWLKEFGHVLHLEEMRFTLSNREGTL